MPIQLSQDLQIALTVAINEAGRLGHEYAGLEHLLYALTLDDETAAVLRHAGADLAALKTELERHLREDVEAVPSRKRPVEPRPSLAFQHVLNRAGLHVESSGRELIEGKDLLVALLEIEDAYAVEVLADQGVNRLDVVQFLAHGVSKLAPGDGRPSRMPADDELQSRLSTLQLSLVIYLQHLLC
ncbi:MAG: Clp protease N-terminal domain-containing protein [Acidobacteriota bacterium]